ncbi:MAG: hypothetical protein Q8R83_08690 [Legionellaceae bacterium]|nr:hypothetical protein [Legionellaceae bacterium]
MHYPALSEQQLSRYTYHWLWGLRVDKTEGMKTLYEEAVAIKSDEPERERLLGQVKGVSQLPWLVSALYWLLNISNYRVNCYRLHSYISLTIYEEELATFTEEDQVKIKSLGGFFARDLSAARLGYALSWSLISVNKNPPELLTRKKSLFSIQSESFSESMTPFLPIEMHSYVLKVPFHHPKVDIESNYSPRVNSSSYVVVETNQHTIVLEYKKEHLPNYLRVEQLLFGNVRNEKYLNSFVQDELLDDTVIHPAAMQAIYQNFIRRNYSELDNSVWYQLGMKNRVSYSKMGNFEDIYLRVNAAFHLLYSESTTPKPLQIEIVLAMVMIREALQANFRRNQYFDEYVFKSVPLLAVEEKDSKTVIITIGKGWLSLERGFFTGEISHLKTVVEHPQQEIDTLTDECGEDKAEEVILSGQLNDNHDFQNQLTTVKKERSELLTSNVRSTERHRFMKPAVDNKHGTSVDEYINTNNL